MRGMVAAIGAAAGESWTNLDAFAQVSGMSRSAPVNAFAAW
ncbi:hypothetical protein AB5J72_05695 [Streptomyces sp. CG1]